MSAKRIRYKGEDYVRLDDVIKILETKEKRADTRSTSKTMSRDEHMKHSSFNQGLKQAYHDLVGTFKFMKEGVK